MKKFRMLGSRAFSEVRVGRGKALADVIGACGGRVLRRCTGFEATGQDFDAGVGIEIEEEGGRIAVAQRDGDAVRRRDVMVEKACLPHASHVFHRAGVSLKAFPQFFELLRVG